MREWFVFYKSFHEAINLLPKENQANAYNFIINYWLNGIEPNKEEDQVAYIVFLLAKPQIDANLRRYENGKKGWRPKTEKKPKANQSKTKAKPKTTLALPTEEYSFIKDFLSLTTSWSTMMQKDKTYTEKQAKEVDMLIKDWYDLETIKTVLRFIAQDSFWSQNIKSIWKLRKKNPDGIPYMLVMIDKIKQWKPAVVNLDKL